MARMLDGSGRRGFLKAGGLAAGAALGAISTTACLRRNSSVGSIPSQITTRVAPARSAANASSPPIPNMPPMSRNDFPGATRAITQYFFDTAIYLRFLERCLSAGIVDLCAGRCAGSLG